MRLQVWWIPQIPMHQFQVEVNSFREAVLLLKTLADYDKFQLENNIKPDYSNTGGLNYWDERIEDEDDEGKWCDWEDEDGDDIWKYVDDEKKLEDFEKITIDWILNKAMPT